MLDPADVHTAADRRAGSVGETDESVRLALALTVRALRNGSVCIDLRTVHATAFDEAESAIDLAELPWPEPEEWLAACEASPLVADGADRAGRAAAAAGRRSALPGAVLAAGGAGSRRSSSNVSPRRPAGDRPATAVGRAAPAVRP